MSAPDETSRSRTPAEIRAEIEATRTDLAEAVEALSAKFDVKTQARQKVDVVTAKLKTPPAYIGVAVATAGLAARMVRRRRRSR